MSEFEDSSSDSSSSESCLPGQPQTYDVSILKHLPEARRILEGQNYEQQVTKCMYELPLSKNPTMTVPKAQPISSNKSQLANNRLTKLEEAMFDHGVMRDKIKGLLGVAGISSNKDSSGSLWSIYSSLTPSYARFGLTIRKANFANVMMPVNGVNIVLGNRLGHDKIPNKQPS